MARSGGRRKDTGLVRVVTINTWKGDGAYRHRLDLLARCLKTIDPDIVLLQESLHAPDAGLSTHQTLAQALDLRACYEPGRQKVRTVEGEEMYCASGLAVLSRFPERSAERITLPVVPEDDDRYGLRVVLDLPDRPPLPVINTHLTHLSGRDDLRHAQMVALMGAVVDDLTQDGPMILGGDMNADRDSRPLDWLTGHRNWLVEASAREAHFPTLVEGDACVDHLFILRDGEARFRVMGGVRRVFDRPDDGGVYPSDHFGVLADLYLG